MVRCMGGVDDGAVGYGEMWIWYDDGGWCAGVVDTRMWGVMGVLLE